MLPPFLKPEARLGVLGDQRTSIRPVKRSCGGEGGVGVEDEERRCRLDEVGESYENEGFYEAEGMMSE